MSSIAISAIAFALVFGGALLGALLGARLPKHHLIDENKEVVRLAMALVGTLTGMALGLLIGSAKTYYDTQSNELTPSSGFWWKTGKTSEQRTGSPRRKQAMSKRFMKKFEHLHPRTRSIG